MTIVYHDVLQGSEEWANLRTGLITASEVKLLVTPATLKAAANDKAKAHLWELLAQRISNYVEPHFYGDDQLRGHEDEVEARRLYAANIGPVEEIGFITNDKWGFTLGYSPDGLIEDRTAAIECKSRRQKYQVQTIVEWHKDSVIPADYLLQCQTGMLVGELNYVDLVSYSGGLPMIPMQVWPDDKVQAAIIEVCGEVERKLAEYRDAYFTALETNPALIPTDRRAIQEIF
jgi:hypothetical protein